MNKKERFFGLHFDYHANAETKGIGKDFNPAILKAIITKVKPDFIQCDTKGHPGFTSYKTSVGYPAPGLEKDLLRMWRDVTKEYDVPLYSHYSGIWDKKAAAEHPSWASLDDKENRTDRMSPFGEYEQKLMLPEFRELIKEYKMDGAWVDGECWALAVDYGDEAQKEYEEKYHKIPAKPGEKGYREYLDFNRSKFLEYVKTYVDAVHSWNPDFMITSNWMNTAWVPDDVAFTDYISGDLSPTNSVDSARFDGRIMAMSERNWDIMSWGINFPVHHQKGVMQLEQEAACVLSLGGGFQIYNLQDPTNVCLNVGGIDSWAEVSAFCHARKDYCYRSEPLPDMGILYSVSSYYDCIEVPYFRDCAYNMELYGTMLGLLDQGTSLDVVSEQRLTKEKLSQYPRFAVSDVTVLPSETKELLLEYAKEGGELLLMGAHTIRLFASSLGLDVSYKEEKHPICFLGDGTTSLEVRDNFSLIEKGNLSSIAFLYPADVAGDVECTNPPPTILQGKVAYPGLASLSYGKGKILLVPLNVGEAYLKEKTVELTNFFGGICLSFKNRAIAHNHVGELEASLRKKDGSIYLHLINLLGPHRVPTVSSFDHIPPLMDVNVSLSLPAIPKRLYLEPEGKEIDFAYDEEAKRVLVHFDEIPLYDIVRFEF